MEPLIVDYYKPINEMARLAMERPDEHIYDDIIVVNGHKVYGFVSMKRIIEYAIMYEKTTAKEKIRLLICQVIPSLTAYYLI